MSRLILPHEQLLDANGNPVSGARAYTYEAGTTTPEPTYSDEERTQSHGNYITADSEGRFPAAYADPAQGFKIIYFDSTGSTQYGDEYDDIYPPADASDADEAKAIFGLKTAASEDIGTSGNTVPKNNTVNSFSALQKFLAGGQAESSDSGAGAGPDWGTLRQSDTPAADDLIGRFFMAGRSSAAADIDYADLIGKIIDPTDAAEYGAAIGRAILNATLTEIFQYGALDSGDTSIQGFLLKSGQFYQIQGATRYPLNLWHQVGETTADGTAANVSFTIPSGCRAFRVHFYNVVPGDDDKEMYMEVQVASSFQTANYQRSLAGRNEATGDYSHFDSSAASVLLTQQAANEGGTTGGEGISGRVEIWGPLGTSTYKPCILQTAFVAASGNLNTTEGAGVYTGGTGALEAVRFNFETGDNIAAGTFIAEALF